MNALYDCTRNSADVGHKVKTQMTSGSGSILAFSKILAYFSSFFVADIIAWAIYDDLQYHFVCFGRACVCFLYQTKPNRFLEV